MELAAKSKFIGPDETFVKDARTILDEEPELESALEENIAAKIEVSASRLETGALEHGLIEID